jgi:hypothetical protein
VGEDIGGAAAAHPVSGPRRDGLEDRREIRRGPLAGAIAPMAARRQPVAPCPQRGA